MLDFIRERGTTPEERRQEALSAYLDGALTAGERERFEAQLRQDARLRAELDQLRLLKQQMRAMPRRRVPRSFALDPNVYGRPKSQPLLQLYPVLRGATALSAFLLIFVLALGIFQGQFGAPGPAAAPEVAMSGAAVEETTPAEMAAMEQPAMPESETQREAPAEGESAADLAMESAPALEGAPEALATMDLTAVPEAAEGGVLSVEATPPPPPTATAEAISEALPVPAESAKVTEPSATSALLWWQVGLAVAFVALLVLFLVARRQARSL